MQNPPPPVLVLKTKQTKKVAKGKGVNEISHYHLQSTSSGRGSGPKMEIIAHPVWISVLSPPPIPTQFHSWHLLSPRIIISLGHTSVQPAVHMPSLLFGCVPTLSLSPVCLFYSTSLSSLHSLSPLTPYRKVTSSTSSQTPSHRLSCSALFYPPQEVPGALDEEVGHESSCSPSGWGK